MIPYLRKQTLIKTLIKIIINFGSFLLLRNQQHIYLYLSVNSKPTTYLSIFICEPYVEFLKETTVAFFQWMLLWKFVTVAIKVIYLNCNRVKSFPKLIHYLSLLFSKLITAYYIYLFPRWQVAALQMTTTKNLQIRIN